MLLSERPIETECRIRQVAKEPDKADIEAGYLCNDLSANDMQNRVFISQGFLDVKGCIVYIAISEGTRDGFMNPKKQGTFWLQVFVVEIEYPVLKQRVKIDDHISADDEVKFRSEEILVPDQVQGAEPGFVSQKVLHLNPVPGFIYVEIASPGTFMLPARFSPEQDLVTVLRIVLIEAVRVASPLCLLQCGCTQVAGIDLCFVPKPRRMQEHHHGIDLLAGRASGMPDLNFILLPKRGEQLLLDAFPDLGVSEEFGRMYGHLPYDLLHKTRVALHGFGHLNHVHIQFHHDAGQAPAQGGGGIVVEIITGMFPDSFLKKAYFGCFNLHLLG